MARRLETFPPEILIMIFQYLDYSDLHLGVKPVCRYFNAVINEVKTGELAAKLFIQYKPLLTAAEEKDKPYVLQIHPIFKRMKAQHINNSALPNLYRLVNIKTGTLMLPCPPYVICEQAFGLGVPLEQFIATFDWNDITLPYSYALRRAGPHYDLQVGQHASHFFLRDDIGIINGPPQPVTLLRDPKFRKLDTVPNLPRGSKMKILIQNDYYGTNGENQLIIVHLSELMERKKGALNRVREKAKNAMRKLGI